MIRATLESLAYQNEDLLAAMEADLGQRISELKVDGGACQNNFLMQFQADISGLRIVRCKSIESTSLGAAYLAGLAVGYYDSMDDIIENKAVERVFYPMMEQQERERRMAGWHRAVKAAVAFAEQ